jgi:hypothetical protein
MLVFGVVMLHERQRTTEGLEEGACQPTSPYAGPNITARLILVAGEIWSITRKQAV